MRYSLRSLMIVVLVASLLLGWWVNRPPEDRIAINGIWQPTMVRRGLQNVGDHVLAEERWAVTDGKYTVGAQRSRNRKIVSLTNVVEVRLDPTRHPKQIDSIVIEGPDTGKIERGIYELKGDALKICWGGSRRPTKFEWKEDDLSIYLVTYKRRSKPPAKRQVPTLQHPPQIRPSRDP